MLKSLNSLYRLSIFVFVLYVFTPNIFANSYVHSSDMLVACFSVIDFGAVGDGIQDDTVAIQSAIDSAAQVGGTVCFPEGSYAISATIHLKGGVILEGAGTGSTSTLTPYNGTILKNIGTDITLRVTGHNAKVKNLIVYDTNNSSAAGGIELLADNASVESVVLENVLIFGFTDGFALKLNAKNNGGLIYSSFYNVRVRHAGTGIHIVEDSTSFVNSNSFFHGAISGGGFDYGLRVQGGNNNSFYGTIIEPPSSTYGHWVVESGEVFGNEIRIEGTSQSNTTPIIHFFQDTYKSKMSGTFAGGLVLDYGDNEINFRGQKSLDFYNSGVNHFENSNFVGLDAGKLPFWEVSGSGVTMEKQAPEVLDLHNTLKITIPAGVNAYLRPKTTAVPEIFEHSLFEHVNFGAFIKTNKSEKVLTSCKSPNGIVSGTYHVGDDKWHFIGMASTITRTQPYDPKFLFDNSSGTDDLVVYVTTPTLCFGTHTPQLEAKPINTAGGVMMGTLSTNMHGATVASDTFLTLEKNGNVFEISGTQTLARINHLTGQRFPKGTIITLLFDNAGTYVINSVYLKLISNYTSTTNSSLTLVSKGDGTWREISRNM